MSHSELVLKCSFKYSWCCPKLALDLTVPALKVQFEYTSKPFLAHSQKVSGLSTSPIEGRLGQVYHHSLRSFSLLHGLYSCPKRFYVFQTWKNNNFSKKSQSFQEWNSKQQVLLSWGAKHGCPKRVVGYGLKQTNIHHLIDSQCIVVYGPPGPMASLGHLDIFFSFSCILFSKLF